MSDDAPVPTPAPHPSSPGSSRTALSAADPGQPSTLADCAQRYAALIDSMEQGYCVLQIILDDCGKPADYRFLEVNQTFSDHTGLVDPVGHTARELVPGLEDSWVETYGRVALTRESYRFEDDAKSMGPRWFEVNAFPIGEPADLLVGLVFVDITQRRLLERAQSDLIAMVSHDLRSPLTALRGRAQIMRRRQEYDDRAISVMLEQIRRIDRLVGDLQEVVRIDADILDLHREPCQLDTILREAVERAGEQPRGGAIVLDLPNGSLEGRWDRDRLGQVFDNLIGNAIKYSPEESAITVRAVVDADAGRVRVSVIDCGPGIPEEALPRLFDRFFRADAVPVHTPTSSHHATGGLGLGLYITRTLVRAHGGEIAVESERDRGTTFTVDLPLDA